MHLSFGDGGNEVLSVLKVWTMVGIYLAIACMAIVIVVLFVDHLPRDIVPKRTNVRNEVRSAVAALDARRPSILIV